MKPSIPLSITYISNAGELSRCVETLAQSRSFAVDLEFDSNTHRYGVTPSLIQLATPAACFVVDLLAGLDPQPLFALLADSTIEKLVHAPGEDLRLLHRLGCFPKNLFDTEVVARLLDYERTGQAALVAEKLGVVLDKGQQRSNWLLRPLSAAQIEYAATDVLWLQPLKEVLVAEAAEKGLMPFVWEEQAALSQTVHTPEATTDFLKPADRLNFTPWEQHLLSGLLHYRDGLARSINRPTYQVMPEALVKDLATGRCSAADLLTRTGVHPRYRNAKSAAALAERLRDLVTEADTQELSKARPRRPRLTPAEQAAWRKAVHDREHLFAPIQEALRNRFGFFATKLLLSDRLVGNLVSGDVSLDDLPPYRRMLFEELAGEAGLEMGGYKR